MIGDFYAQTACNETGGRALVEMMDEFALESIDDVAEEIIRRSETAVRAEIDKLPKGEWTHETWSDGYEEPIVVRCTVKVAGDEIFIDFTGSSPQSSRGINVREDPVIAQPLEQREHLAPVVVRRGPAARPMEDVRRDRVVADRSEPSGHIHDVVVHPERFLDHDHTAARLTVGCRLVERHRAVRRVDLDRSIHGGRP